MSATLDQGEVTRLNSPTPSAGESCLAVCEQRAALLHVHQVCEQKTALHHVRVLFFTGFQIIFVGFFSKGSFFVVQKVLFFKKSGEKVLFLKNTNGRVTFLKFEFAGF
jgi:hypothetical protein